jgi:hypothetical protein
MARNFHAQVGCTNVLQFERLRGVHKNRMENAQRDLRKMKDIVGMEQDGNSARFAATADVSIVWTTGLYICDSKNVLIVLLRAACKRGHPLASSWSFQLSP